MTMDSGMLPYERSSAPLSRSLLAPQYFSTPAFNPTPITSMPAPPYQAPMGFEGFAAYSPPTSAAPSPYRQHFSERPPVDIVTGPDMSHARMFHREVSVHASRSPSVKSETQASVARSIVSTSSGPPRTLASIVPVNPANQISFNTEVDVLVKALQSKKDTDVIVKKVEAEQLSQTDVRLPEPVMMSTVSVKSPGSQAESLQGEGRLNRKRYACDIAGCGKTFFQKTHLDIHKRSHTGDKPYCCKLPGCGSRFSQLGNLKTHERRHTGEKPFHCEQCGKRFAQRGNVRAHLKTHLNTKPYECRLDDCGKRFTQLGNLKSHQNKFHAKTIKRLTQKFAQLKDYDKASEAERQLWEYFATLYKNSNKGIKGRGKDRKVDPGPHASPMTPRPTMLSHAHSVAPQGHLQTSPSHHYSYATSAMQLPLPHSGVSHPAAYSMSRSAFPTGALAVGHRDSQAEYQMFDVGDGTAVVGTATQPHHATMYDVDHTRDLAFGDRLYG